MPRPANWATSRSRLPRRSRGKRAGCQSVELLPSQEFIASSSRGDIGMRKYLHINLDDRSVRTEKFQGEAIVRAGRHFIAKTLLELGAAGVDPLSPDNPLIFSAGPFAGTNFSNANRLSVGCKSPLTGGIKEANSGGTFGFALGQLEISGFTLYGACKEWVVIRITKEGAITYETAEPFMGKGNNEVAALLFEKYGKKISFALRSEERRV